MYFSLNFTPVQWLILPSGSFTAAAQPSLKLVWYSPLAFVFSFRTLHLLSDWFFPQARDLQQLYHGNGNIQKTICWNIYGCSDDLSLIKVFSWQAQGCYSDFGSNKERKKDSQQGKKTLGNKALNRIFFGHSIISVMKKKMWWKSINLIKFDNSI